MSFGFVNTLESKLDKTGGTILGDLTIEKNLTIHNTLTVNNKITQTNGTSTLGNIDIYPFTELKPKISFHYNNLENPTSYIIEDEEGYLSLNKTPDANDCSKKIATTEWVKINPVPYVYAMVDANGNLLNIGDNGNPVYFKDGIPVATGNILNKDISGNAATATYAVDAGHAVNADEAIQSTNANLSNYATKADEFTFERTLSFSGVIEGRITNFNINKENVVNISRSSTSQLSSMVADWSNVKRAGSYYKATEYCYAIIGCRDGEPDGKIYFYNASGGHVYTLRPAGETNYNNYTTRTIPLEPGAAVSVDGLWYNMYIVGVKK